MACLAVLGACAREPGAAVAGDGGDHPVPDAAAPDAGESDTTAALVALSTCDDVDRSVRAAAKRAFAQLVADWTRGALQALAQGVCSGNIFYGPGAGAGAGGGGVSPVFGDGSRPTDVSETNNQLRGVDEPDFVKNDDGYIYVLADGAFQIIDAWPAAQAHVISRTALPFAPKRMFVAGDRALLVLSKPTTAATTPPAWYAPVSECTYGYDCDFTGDGNATELALYDITDRSAPRLIRTIKLSGSFVSARRIDSAVHVMIYDEPALMRDLASALRDIDRSGLCTGTVSYGPFTYPVFAEGDIERAWARYGELASLANEIIDQVPLDALTGGIDDRVEGQARVLRDPCEGFYDSPLADGTSLIHLLSFDMESDTPIGTSTIISRPGATYASADAYYVAVRQQRTSDHWFGDLDDGEAEASTVHQFALTGPANAYVASGVVKGRVLNQFAMDEHAGHLRIATTTGHLPNPNVHSTLSVLARDGRDLVRVGVVDDIAPTEDIRSVRFLGDRGYVVTFKKTDPLFVFDLSVPEHPEMIGELKIPGFSTYMHPLDDDHLLAIGFEASEQGSVAYFQGLQLQVFDVADPAMPALAHKTTIGTRGSSSEAATNHLAFNYFAPRQTLAVPVTVCEGSSGGSSFGTMTFSGVKLYSVTVDGGFSLTGDISHPYVDAYANNGTYGVGAACSSWWTQARSMVKRTVFMDDFVYTISEQRIKVNDLRDLSQEIADVTLVSEP